MRKFSIELPKYRLQLHMRLIKRRRPLIAKEPLLPTPSVVRRKYRKGTFIGKAVRHVSYHKSAKKVFAANMAAFVIAGTFLPTAQAQTLPGTDQGISPDEVVIQTGNTLKTEKSIQYPLDRFKVNQGFSFYHPGVDLGAEIGAPVKPIKAGNVIEAGYATDGYGNTILIDHGKGLTSRYAHLSEIETAVGEKVTTENEIGKVGMTGHTTGPHLHLEIWQNGSALNPLAVLSR